MPRRGNPALLFPPFYRAISCYSYPTFLFVSGFFIAFATGSKKNTVSWKIVFARIKYLVNTLSFLVHGGYFWRFTEGKNIYSFGVCSSYSDWNDSGTLLFCSIINTILSAFTYPGFAGQNRSGGCFCVTVIIQIVVLLTYYFFLFHIEIPLLPKGFLLPSWLFLSRIFWFHLHCRWALSTYV